MYCTIGLVRSSVAKKDLHCTFLTWRSRESWLRIKFVLRVLHLRSVQYICRSTLRLRRVYMAKRLCNVGAQTWRGVSPVAPILTAAALMG
jgi:hypothetical protein